MTCFFLLYIALIKMNVRRLSTNKGIECLECSEHIEYWTKPRQKMSVNSYPNTDSISCLTEINDFDGNSRHLLTAGKTWKKGLTRSGRCDTILNVVAIAARDPWKRYRETKTYKKQSDSNEWNAWTKDEGNWLWRVGFLRPEDKIRIEHQSLILAQDERWRRA